MFEYSDLQWGIMFCRDDTFTNPKYPMMFMAIFPSLSSTPIPQDAFTGRQSTGSGVLVDEDVEK